MPTLIGFLLFALLGAGGVRAEDVEPGMLLPSGSFHDLDGNVKPIADLRAGAKLTVLVFWATWSGSSLEEIGRLGKLEPLCAKGLRVLLVNVDGEILDANQERRVAKVAADFPASFLSLRDEGLAMFREYGVYGVPTSFVVDSNGMVTFRLPGFPVAGGAKMLSYLENSLNDRPALAGPWSYQPNPRAVRYYHLARLLLRKGDLAMALHTLQRATDLDREYVAPLELLGDLERTEGRLKEALAHYDLALRFNPDSPSVLSKSGQCLALLDDLETGLVRSRRAVQQAPGDARAHAYLGLTLAIAQRFEESRVAFASGVELAPYDPLVFELQGQAYERLGMHDDAIDAYWHAFDLIQNASDPELAFLPAGKEGAVGGER